MTKYTMFVRSGITLIGAAVLSLGLGCKQPNSPPGTGEPETPGGTADLTLSPADKSGSLRVTASGSLSLNKTSPPRSVELTIAEAGFSGFHWFVDGVLIENSGNGLSLSDDKAKLTINAEDQAIKPGGHSVTVYTVKDAVYWSPENPIQFTVR